ncbi:MAG: hypothetical protein OXF66_07905 [Gammaproteobacteria bacterium]|nr:hypothetical protein [Gammaproteobacteria bacterium]MCY4165816.1 hypothetical protein [Gammaproteobacteria bacterium]
MSNASALLRLEDFAAIKVSGKDRLDFLQGQLTQDMGKVTAARAAPAAWCNRQGRVIGLMAALEWNDATYLALPAEISAACVEGLGRFVLRAKVRIEPSALPVFGCANADRLFPAAGEAWACGSGSGYCAARLPGPAHRALLLGSPPGALANAADSGWTAERWRLADIEAEIPWIGARTTEKFLAHSLNLDRSGAVSFTKGCYVGQEIIARMEHRGTPKRRMRRVRLAGESGAEPGEKFQHPERGAITIISAAPAGAHIEALAEVRQPPPSGPNRQEQP